jgi:hypothetical protein
MGSSPETVAKTPQQVVMEGRQERELAEQTRKSERRLKQVARGRLGKKTLLEKPIGQYATIKEQKAEPMSKNIFGILFNPDKGETVTNKLGSRFSNRASETGSRKRSGLLGKASAKNPPMRKNSGAIAKTLKAAKTSLLI